MSELERHVTDMTAVAHAARVETNRLKVDLDKRQGCVAGIAQGRETQEGATAAPSNPGGARNCESSGDPDAPLPEVEGRRKARSAASSPLDTPIAIVGDTPNLTAPTFGGGGEKEEEDSTRKANATAATQGVHGTAAQQQLLLALRLAEAEERAASTEQALVQARDTSKTAIEHFALLGRQLELARAAEKAEAEARRTAQTRIVELERDIELSGQEQERIRDRAESRLESLKAAFEQEELEAGGKVPQPIARGG